MLRRPSIAHSQLTPMSAKCCKRSIANSASLSILAWNKIQKQLWSDMERIRLEFERVIHAELRTVRQRSSAAAPSSHTSAPHGLPRVRHQVSRHAGARQG